MTGAFSATTPFKAVARVWLITGTADPTVVALSVVFGAVWFPFAAADPTFCAVVFEKSSLLLSSETVAFDAFVGLFPKASGRTSLAFAFEIV